MCFFSSCSYLFYSIQHALASLPWFGVLPYAAQTGHAVPLPILQFSVKGIGQQQHGIIDVAVGDLRRNERKDDRRKGKKMRQQQLQTFYFYQGWSGRYLLTLL